MARRKSLDDEMQFISSRELEAAADMLLREADMKDKGGKKTTKKSKADKDSKTEKVTKTRTVKVLKSDKSEKTEEGNAAEGEESTKAEAQKLSEEDEKLFNDTLERLLAIAKSRKSVIEDTEIIDAFKNKQEFLTDENMNRVIEFFEQNKVDVLTITDDDDDVEPDDLLFELDDEEEIDMEQIDLSVPDGVSIEDPVRMYLKDIGKVPLLTAEDRKALLLRRSLLRQTYDLL